MPNEKDPTNADAFKNLFKYEPEKVEGKNIIVTGGTTGIGRAVAMLLVAQKANVLIFGRDEHALNEALGDLKKVGGGQVYGLKADVTNMDDVQRVFETADREFGTLHALVNNAALAAKSVLDMEYAEWRGVIETNLIAYMLISKHAADRFRKAKGGHLVQVGSMSAKVEEVGSDVYVATKAGIHGFTDSLAKQLNEEGIRVTLIEPGLVGTDMTVDQVAAKKQAAAIEKQEMLRAEDLAHTVLYVLQQPQRCNVALIQVRPTKQII